LTNHALPHIKTNVNVTSLNIEDVDQDSVSDNCLPHALQTKANESNQ